MLYAEPVVEMNSAVARRHAEAQELTAQDLIVPAVAAIGLMLTMQLLHLIG